MLNNWTHRALVSTTLITLAFNVSAARADGLLCASFEPNPANGEAWQVICAAAGASAYADVKVEPTATGEKASIHVTDQHDCPDDTHLECGFSSGGDIACLVEDNVELSYNGHLSSVLVYCGCYSPTTTCASE